VWEEHMGRHASPEGALRDVPHVKLVITGDFHGHKVTTLTARDGRTLRVASPGSTCLQDVSEDPDKYFFVLYDDLSLRSVALKGRPLYRFKAYTQPQLDELVREWLPQVGPDWGVLPEHVATPVVQVKYLDALPEAEARIKAAAGDRCHLFLSPVSPDREDREDKRPQAAEGPQGLEWHLQQAREEDPAKHATALRLWRSNDLKGEVRAVIEEALQVNEEMENQGIWASTRGPQETADDPLP